ncbi:TetR/AcrR family transcriptional regulator [Clostridiaceae bacterium NSJ-31]|uniref:TetR/AcrR family transcriptional regulator n=1 Tax=Ligaoa zhengdingensis TaxID=2763658 RepID=A0A926I3S8_9FIRM|nr:TetR/AcrR family transcriptional regulator [Ligaoa zhengdingensis]MBC8546649.1 TetR/AcrR family transcriptional regulator [Ligaoa zhengdingensis]
METKKKWNVSNMKSKIIEESIKSLQAEGLRFSVDTLAERMKISKKTVYKYFSTKEALAYAIYEKFYTDLKGEIEKIIQAGTPKIAEELLLRYFSSAKMVRKEIFNKYCLNNKIGDFAVQGHLDVWDTIKPYVCGSMNDDEAGMYQLIIDGAFDKAIACSADSAIIVRMLRQIK